MIQFKRGKTTTWHSQSTPLADGQPGYDKERHKIKIGNGTDPWSKLPDASGLRLEEILESEENAKRKAKKSTLGTLIAKALNLDDRPVFTYGTTAPDDETIGQVYLQYYDDEPEVDYVVDSGIDGIWSYQKWHSGKVTCNGVVELNKITVSTVLEGSNLYYDKNSMSQIPYPFTIKGPKISGKDTAPSEVATLQNPGGSSLAWLASRVQNTTKESGAYSIISLDKQNSTTNYKIAIHVEGFLK